MKLSVGIVGLPNVGKSTLFKKLTNQDINIANYPFATIDPNVGVIAVPDGRLDKLAAVSQSQNKIPAVVEFYDIAGLVKGASKGEGLGNQFLTHIRETTAIIHLVRVFSSGDIVHIDGEVNPERDIDTILYELAMKDIETLTNRLGKIEGEVKVGRKEAIKEKEVLTSLLSRLNDGRMIAADLLDEFALSVIKPLNLLTAKPQLFLLNGSDSDVPESLKRKISQLGFDFMVADLAVVDAVPELIKKSYQMLNLITFFTSGEKETRAWTVYKNTKAPQAAGAIHSDFEKNFIKAEVAAYQSFVDAGGWQGARKKGLVQLKGKEYEIQDGDVVYFKVGK